MKIHLAKFFTKSISSNGVWKKPRINSLLILRITALFAVAVMFIGLADRLLQIVPVSFPGPSTISLEQIVHSPPSNTGLVMMSAGIIFFALIPSLRVLLGLNQFFQKHETVNLIVAMIVLLELTASMLWIFFGKWISIG
jgi:uncharacterized membrane protein